MMADQIINFEIKCRGLSLVDFVQGTLLATRETIQLGDPSSPIDVFADAEVNAADLSGRFGWQGRWIAKCPSCSGAEYVDFRNPVFMCCCCWNTSHGHEWLRVRIPEDREAIEAVLLLRPGRNRIWTPGETLQDLLEENKDHGIEGVPS